ncbi:MAG TPA: hypothetical protein VGP82_11105 [Ktedonobacterales bacterium]|nr:hypothetical protein [Ktedonobacterales bacterium]
MPAEQVTLVGEAHVGEGLGEDLGVPGQVLRHTLALAIGEVGGFCEDARPVPAGALAMGIGVLDAYHDLLGDLALAWQRRTERRLEELELAVQEAQGAPTAGRQTKVVQRELDEKWRKV